MTSPRKPRPKRAPAAKAAPRRATPAPPSLEAVLGRSRALAMLYVRSRIEGGLRFTTGTSKEKWAELASRLDERAALDAAVFSPWERRVMRKPLGRVTDAELVQADWRLESLGVLLWATGQVPRLPAWHQSFHPNIVGLVDVPSWADEPRRQPKLRAAAVLDRTCDLAELWHWRTKRPRRDAAVEKAARVAKARGDLTPVGGDFPWRGRALGTLDAEAAADARSTAYERHYALVWLTSDGTPWDRVDPAT